MTAQRFDSSYTGAKNEENILVDVALLFLCGPSFVVKQTSPVIVLNNTVKLEWYNLCSKVWAVKFEWLKSNSKNGKFIH